MTVISLELNELNFDFIRSYIGDGHLPNFARALKKYQLFETVSEPAYPYLEPWIQWPTVYTGLTYSEHGIFRLGDCVYKRRDQIWEKLEQAGISVGAISPMNAVNAAKAPDFFLPDPWTNTAVTADNRTTKLFELVRETVNENASSDLSTFNLGRQLLPLALPYLQANSLGRYMRILPMALRHKWAKAAFLDSLLVDVFTTLINRHQTQFASLFLNAGAHIQHHHIYDSEAYKGDRRNPKWYSSAAENGEDPLLFIYNVYDRILGQLSSRHGTRVLVSTGLSQIPNERDHYQYRIVDFEAFFTGLELKGAQIEPRMSRDFLLIFDDTETAIEGIRTLERVTCNGKPLFTIENRGQTLFCQVGFFGPPEGLSSVDIDGIAHDMQDEFVLVSIENGVHQTRGYHLDTGITNSGEPVQISLTEVHQRLIAAALHNAGNLSIAA